MCVCVCAQLYPTSCDPMDCSSPGSSVHRISQGRILKWAAISYSRNFPTHGLNPHLLRLLHWQTDSLPLHHLGNPYIVKSQNIVGLENTYKTCCLLLGILSLVRELRYYLNVQQVVVPNQTTNIASGMERKNPSLEKNENDLER